MSQVLVKSGKFVLMNIARQVLGERRSANGEQTMLNLSAPGRVYLACGSTDMRNSIDGLAAMVSCSFKLDPFSDCTFVFCDRGL